MDFGTIPRCPSPLAVVPIRAAKCDRHVTSLANVLGSNVFDLLIAVPAGIVLAGSAVIDYAVAAPMMAFLVVATVVLFTVLRTDLHLTDNEGRLLLGVYALFLCWMLLEAADVVSFVPSL